MTPQRLIQLANGIADHFAGEPERSAQVSGVATHLDRFWEPRMRRKLLEWIDDSGGDGLSELVLAAVATRREDWERRLAAAGR